MHEIDVFQVGKIPVKGILSAGNSLGLEVVVEAVDAESTCRIAEEMADQIPQGRDIADAVTLHHVAQNDHVHVFLQDCDTMVSVHALHLGKASRFEIGTQTVRENGSALRPGGRSDSVVISPVAQGFAKAERKYFRG